MALFEEPQHWNGGEDEAAEEGEEEIEVDANGVRVKTTAATATTTDEVEELGAILCREVNKYSCRQAVAPTRRRRDDLMKASNGMEEKSETDDEREDTEATEGRDRLNEAQCTDAYPADLRRRTTTKVLPVE